VIELLVCVCASGCARDPLIILVRGGKRGGKSSGHDYQSQLLTFSCSIFLTNAALSDSRTSAPQM
jgi:hypothetical protein